MHYCKTPLPPHFFYESFFSIVLVNRNQTNSSDKILESRKHSIKHSIVQSNTIILSKIILVTNFDHFFLKFLVHSTVLFDTSSIHSKLLARYYQRDKKKMLQWLNHFCYKSPFVIIVWFRKYLTSLRMINEFWHDWLKNPEDFLEIRSKDPIDNSQGDLSRIGLSRSVT